MMGISFLIALSLSIEEDDNDGFMWGLSEEDEGPKPINWSTLPVHDVIILGSGPGGNTAALYTARAGYKPLVLHGSVPGGQLTTTTEIENFPAFKGTGPGLVKAMQKQAADEGAIFEAEKIISVNLSVFPRRLESESHKGYLCKTLIVATGATARYLGLPNEQRLRNKGVSACAVCDGALYQGQDVVVVGGGDVAIEEALYLSKICKSTTIIHRHSSLSASLPMKKKLNASSVKIVYNTTVVDVIGDDYVTGVQTKNIKSNEVKTISASAVFLAIGHSPATEPFKGQLEMDDHGYFVTNGSPATKVPGVYVCGDCADKIYRQAITSAGTGCQAALLAEKFLSELEN